MNRSDLEKYIGITRQINYWTEKTVTVDEKQEDGTVIQVLKKLKCMNSVAGIINTVMIKKIALILMDDESDTEIMIPISRIESVTPLVIDEGLF